MFEVKTNRPFPDPTSTKLETLKLSFKTGIFWLY
jgi:hypothetical protein